MPAPMAVLAKGVRGAARYLGSVMGADAYTRYLEHHQATGHQVGAPDRAGVLA